LYLFLIFTIVLSFIRFRFASKLIVFSDDMHYLIRYYRFSIISVIIIFIFFEVFPSRSIYYIMPFIILFFWYILFAINNRGDRQYILIILSKLYFSFKRNLLSQK
jgi:hypothetical protein